MIKFRRTTKILHGPIDPAPLASVLFLLLIFLMLQSSLVFTPGVPIHLPDGPELPGIDRPRLAVAVDSKGQLYFENQVIELDALRDRLRQAKSASVDPLTLVVMADRAVTCEALTQLGVLAREVGIADLVMATRPPATPRTRLPSP